ncbi:hypothetical protein VC83_08136 [Pseudogymnoascus destructans]|uniref:Large ribosomal subunit protein mL67 n=2 Tax=Pseudogymnoascus destructans TaxID=655981 RepID=L8FYH3_PSED2|nr:uncharacterized protein VC83_08136 [Pseudogymnoascus destructans]ELR06055.1 hypothetical protein GMDG_07766 [Pseudogymnoascus destructans 20631-21]OAF55249.1 hypothetical protein VC83_08136 [Pseudogymnoascus destructans]
MSTSTASQIARRGARFADKVRNASVSVKPEVEHGRQIFVYSHLQTKQVVYSLKQNVKNNKALRQLPYNGKKTVPAALRKDLWSPLARIEFPAGHSAAGLNAFRMLREYRTLHETQWPKELALDDKGRTLSRKLRGRKLCDQRANSIADISATLGKVSKVEKEVGDKAEKGVEQISTTVRWSDILDAEYAASWPESVVHDNWETTRNNRRAIEEFPEEY